MKKEEKQKSKNLIKKLKKLLTSSSKFDIIYI
jgi:hypothetical protein